MADPVATYHYVHDKIHNNENPDDTYPGPEMARDLALMLLAAKSLIQHNGSLAERVLKAEKASENAQVDLLSKDLENYELLQKLNDLKKAGPS